MKPLRLLVAMVSMSSIGASAARFAVLVYAAQAGASPAMVGLLAALFSIVGAIASVPVGRIIDRAGTKKPLLFASAVLVVVISLGALERAWPMLVLIMVLGGLAYNTLIIAYQRLAGDLAPPDRRAEAFAMLAFGFSISLLAAPMIAGFSIDFIGFTASFVLFALIPLGTFTMVWTDRLPWSPPAGGRSGDGGNSGHGASLSGGRSNGQSVHDAKTAPARSGTLGLLRAPALKPLWVCCAAFESGWVGFTFLLPVVGTQLGFSASRIGLIVGMAGFMLFLTRACLARLLRRFTPWQLLIAGLALGGAGFVGLAFAGEFLWMALSAGLIGVGQGACSPMQNALTYENSPDHEKGEAMALRVLISNAAQGITPLVAGTLSAAFGATAVFLALAAGMAGTSWWSRAHWRRRTRGG